MSEAKEINAGHPLWKELRNGLLWHRTSAGDYRQMKKDTCLKPNDGRIDRWGGKYACQELGGISLFDFTSESEERVLGEAHKWQQFLGDSAPVTILLGWERESLTGKLVPYPDNKHGTKGNIIPWVEVCHCGTIPLTSVVSHLLVCAVDYRLFRRRKSLDERELASVEESFSKRVEADRTRRTELHKHVRAVEESPSFKARLAEAKRRVEESRRQQ